MRQKISFQFIISAAIWIISAGIYFLSASHAISQWDSGELVAAAYKLQVSHAPGFPLYMLIARVFSFVFSFGNPNNVVIAVTLVSVFSAAFLNVILFKTTVVIAEKYFKNFTHNNIPLIIGIISSLSFAFTDSFWNVAISTNSYALFYMLLALFIYFTLKYYLEEDSEKQKKMYLILIGISGLSNAVNIVAPFLLPLLVYVYTLKNVTISFKNIVISIFAGLTLFFICYFVVIPGIPYILSYIDYACVNGLHLPINVGAYIFLAIFFSGIFYLIYKYVVLKQTKLGFIVLSLFVYSIGFLLYSIIIIRADANTPLNFSNPNNNNALYNYIRKAQNPHIPLFYGEYYNAPLTSFNEGSSHFIETDSGYVAVKDVYKPSYHSSCKTLFPRMWSMENQHIHEYKSWANIQDGENTVPLYEFGATIHKPSFKQNVLFFSSYQLNYMYVRYLMWNFSGKQNNILGNGQPYKGNWITGIWLLDNLRLGAQDALPETYKQNASHNIYFALPFIFALLGFWLLFKSSKKLFSILVYGFFLTGFLLVFIYNFSPLQVRDRDYIFIASFYVFSIAIGFSFLIIKDLLHKKLPKYAHLISILIVSMCPIILFSQNLNDHNFSKHNLIEAQAKNALQACKPNSVLFTTGDNDTFPLWFLQEVNGYRTDVRVVNLSLSNTDWYINQLRQKKYNSEALPITLPKETYNFGTNTEIFALANKQYGSPIALGTIAHTFVASNQPQHKYYTGSMYLDYIPTHQIAIPTYKEWVFSVFPHVEPWQVEDIIFVPIVNKSQNSTDTILNKKDLFLFDLITSNNWNRALLFSVTVQNSEYFDISKNKRLSGLHYEFVPYFIKPNFRNVIEVDIDSLYNQITKTFSWGNSLEQINNIDFYTYQQAIYFRKLCNLFAESYIQLGQIDKANEILLRSIELFPDSKIPFEKHSLQTVNLLFSINNTQKANECLQLIQNNCNSMLLYFMSLPATKVEASIEDITEYVDLTVQVFQKTSENNLHAEAHALAQTYCSFVENIFEFSKQITICEPMEFEYKNQWMYKLSKNNQYIASWYNIMKLYLQQ